MSAPLKAPFPWFGGKSRVAEVAWRAFGDVPNYVEPFFGSGATLLGRPHAAKIETVNDKDCYLANFWRAIAAAPNEVAIACDWPVNEADLHARHRELVSNGDFRERMKSEPKYFDAEIAGWWVWGLSQWIGGGWCSVPKDGGLVNQTRPSLSTEGTGVHTKRGNGAGVHKRTAHMRNGSIVRAEARPDLQARKPSNRPQGVHVKLPDLNAASRGRGVHQLSAGGLIRSRLPSLGNERGVHGAEAPPCSEWFAALQARLRRVRVCCGDWKRVLGNSVLGTTKSRNSGNPCAVFLDPPYSFDERDAHLYATDDGKVSLEVAQWARDRGDDKDLRIALCGYEGEHTMPASWTCYAWKAHRGYASETNDNASRERIWFSPHCMPLESRQTSLFGRVG